MRKFHIPGKAKGRRAGVPVMIAAALLLLTVLVGTVIGRYQRQFRSEGLARAKEFYFTSDFLDGETHTLAPGSTEVTFTLSSHADELRFSEVDIMYDVTVSPADGVTVEYDNGTKKFSGVDIKAENVPIEKYTHKVTVKGLRPGKTYTVTATGNGGYEKTLTASIEVLATEAAVYKYLDTTNRDYVLLTVWAQNWQGTVTVTPPAGMIPDNTDQAMASAKTGEAFSDAKSFQSSPYSSHTYRFFYGEAAADGGMTADEFTVTCNDGSKTITATEKAPG